MAGNKSRSSAKPKAAKSASTKASTRRRRAKPEARPQGVRVRMYRQGFGDCLLVDLPGDGPQPLRILIDCGVLWATPDAAGRMRKVVESLIADTGGYVDVLAVTHEHWDHVSAFAQVRELFAMPDERRSKAKLSVGEVWLAWTEDPSDRLAALLRAERRSQLSQLVGLVNGLRAAGPLAALPLAGALANLLGFFALSANATSDALDIAKSLGPHRYWRPADLPWRSARAPGVRIYALGPPPDATMLRRLMAQSEVYREFSGLPLADAFFAAAADKLGIGLDADARERQALYVPFDRTDWLPLEGDGLSADTELVRTGEEVTALRQFFATHYWGMRDDGSADESWRRIDHDWLATAAELALQLDAATNNTSLVLAIELVESRKVLLFAADAQVGNWLTWHDLAWTLEEGTMVTGHDLLERTVFYKTGHHGSHNATLKDKGLELMRRDGLVAFVPVDEETAVSRNWNRIPFPPLIAALQSRGTVVRSDLGIGEDTAQGPLAGRLQQTELYVEYTLPI
jgi:hypothetical protein